MRAADWWEQDDTRRVSRQGSRKRVGAAVPSPVWRCECVARWPCPPREAEVLNPLRLLAVAGLNSHTSHETLRAHWAKREFAFPGPLSIRSSSASLTSQPLPKAQNPLLSWELRSTAAVRTRRRPPRTPSRAFLPRRATMNGIFEYWGPCRTPRSSLLFFFFDCACFSGY